MRKKYMENSTIFSTHSSTLISTSFSLIFVKLDGAVLYHILINDYQTPSKSKLILSSVQQNSFLRLKTLLNFVVNLSFVTFDGTVQDSRILFYRGFFNV